jgi:hypothetical protein
MDQVKWIQDMDEFHNLMQKQIERNAHKGMQESWLAYPLEKCMIQLQISQEELRVALAHGVDVDDKAADVANWSFIIQNIFYKSSLARVHPNARFSGD